MKIQVIGLPGSGKTFLIQKYIKNRESTEIVHLDIATYKNSQKDGSKPSFKQKIKNARNNILAESACGVYCGDTEVIKLVIDDDVRRSQYKKRDKKDADIQYESLLETSMVPATYTVKTEKALFDILDTLFKRQI